MAIFGSFEEMPPAEVLTVVGKATGTIFVTSAALGALQIHVRDGLVVGLERDGRPAADALELHGVITSLLQQREGSFEFRRRGMPGHPAAGQETVFEASLAQLVMSGLSFTEETRAFQDAMPSPKTIFEVLREPVVWLGDRLQPFYERTEASLRVGASAEELATIARVPVQQACWFLYKLRLAGVIQPRRSVASPASARLPLLATASGLAAASPAEGSDADLRHVQVARPAGNFLSRMISSLSKLLGPASPTL